MTCSSRPAGSSPTTTSRRSRRPAWPRCSGRARRSARWPSTSGRTPGLGTRGDAGKVRHATGQAKSPDAPCRNHGRGQVHAMNAQPAIDPAARAAELAEAAVGGDRRALARLLTAVENRGAVSEHALRRLYPRAGRAHLVGITGPPGAGKSTIVAALIALLRAAGRSVAVLAIDPSSADHGRRHARRPSSDAGPTPTIRMCSSARWRPAGTPAASPRRPRPRPPSSTRPASRRSSSRPSAPARARSRWPRSADTTRGARGARDGRRDPGHQGRPARGRRHRGREQVRSARCSANGRTAAGHAHGGRAARGNGRAATTQATRGPARDGSHRRRRSRAAGRDRSPARLLQTGCRGGGSRSCREPSLDDRRGAPAGPKSTIRRGTPWSARSWPTWRPTGSTRTPRRTT